MESNRRYPEDDNRRNLEENQRIGKNIARERGNQNWNEQYRSGKSYHNQNEGFGPEQTHYGARPDSAYRNPNINFGNRSEQNNQNYQDRYNQQNNQRPENNQRFERNDQRFNAYNQNNFNRNYNGFSNQNRNPNTNYHEQSSGERHYDRDRDTWPERNEYKDDDYRFRSGNRGNWHAPEGLGNPDNDRYRNQRDYRDRDDYRNYNQDRNRNDNRNQHDQDRDQGFFGRIGNSISNTWNNLTNPDDYHPANEGRNYGSQNRNSPRGYESGPRWSNESETDHRARERKDFRADLE